MPLYELDGIRPQVPASGRYWIAPDAHVIGNVIIEEDAAVWFGAVIRGDNDPISRSSTSNAWSVLAGSKLRDAARAATLAPIEAAAATSTSRRVATPESQNRYRARRPNCRLSASAGCSSGGRISVAGAGASRKFVPGRLRLLKADFVVSSFSTLVT